MNCACTPLNVGDVWLDSTKVRRYNAASYFLITKTYRCLYKQEDSGLCPGAIKGQHPVLS